MTVSGEKIADQLASAGGEALSQRARYGALLLAVCWTFLLAWLWVGAPALPRAIGLAWALLGAWRPDFYFYSLALALPWFGDQNGSPLPIYLLEFGLLGILTRHQLRRALGLVARRRQPLDGWLLLFLYLSICSGIVNWHWIYTEWFLNRINFLYINFNHYGTSETYAVQAAVRLAISVGLYFALRDDPWPRGQQYTFIYCALLALAAASVLGLLDYSGFMSLEWWRPKNADITRFTYPRLQSLFGHSGWFAEYLAFFAPFSLALGVAGATRARRWAGWSMASFLLPVQLLTMQRGEWVALGAGYGAVMVVHAMVRRDRRVWIRGVILPALFFAVCVVLLLVASPEFRNRFGEMLKFNDRTGIWASAWELMQFSRMRGVGFGNYFNYHRFVFPEGHPYYLLDKSTAHNLYLHLWTERGLVGLILFLIIIYHVLRSLMRSIRGGSNTDLLPLDLRLGVFGGMVAYLFDGIVQYPPYIRLLEIILFLLIGFSSWAQPPIPVGRKFFRRLIWLVVLIGLPISYLQYYALELRQVEAWVLDRHMKIGREEVLLDVPSEGTRFRLPLASIHSSLDVWPVEMTVSFDGIELQRVMFGRIERRDIEITLPAQRQPWQRVSVKASRVYSPLRDAGWRNPPVPLIGVLYLPLEPIESIRD